LAATVPALLHQTVLALKVLRVTRVTDEVQEISVLQILACKREVEARGLDN